MRISRFRKSIFVILVLILIIFFYQWVKNIAEIYPIGKFSVKIRNESDSDIVIVKAGIVSKESNVLYDKKISTGERGTIKPDLQLTGEGAVYLEYIDSKGDTKNVVVCGYTESLSGHSKLTIRDDRFELEQNCM